MAMKGLDALDLTARQELQDEVARHEEAVRGIPGAGGNELAAEVIRYLARVDQILCDDARRRLHLPIGTPG
jgi:hypothetical protein